MKNQMAVSEINIEELHENIEMLMLETGIENWNIIETFKKSGSKEFSIVGLHIESEDGQVFCYDENNNPITGCSETYSVLIGFLVEDVKIIKHSDTVFELIFIDGNVIIEGIY